MTQARARAIETEVTSLLNELPYDPRETWLLHQSKMLCVLRYEEDHPRDAMNEDQVPKYTDEEAQRRRPLKSYSGRTSGPWPGYPVPESSSNSSKAAWAKF
jgi:hypothetical protein